MCRRHGGRSLEAARLERAEGFSLVEVLTALAVLSVVSVLILQSYQRTMDLFHRGGAQLRQTRALVELLEDLERDLTTMLPGPGPAVGAGEAGGLVLRLRSGSGGQRYSRAEGLEAFELAYRLEAAGGSSFAALLRSKRPERKTLVRELRRAGEEALLERKVYGLEVARLEAKVAAAGPRRSIRVQVEHRVGTRTEATETAQLLIEPLASGVGKVER